MKLTAEDHADLARAADIGTANWRIKGASSAGMIHAGLQLLLVVGTVVIADTPARPAGFLGLIDVAVILALSFGVARRSRTCAVLLLLYVVVSILGSLVLLNLSGVVLRSVFAYFYVQGVRGTFAYHRLVTEQAALSEDSAAAK